MERGVLNRRSSLDLLEDLDMGMGSFNMGSVGVGVSVAGGAGVGIGIGGVGVGVGSTAKWGRSASPRGDDSQFPLDDLHVDSGFFTGDSSSPSAAEQRVGMGAHSSLGGQGGGMGHMGGVDMPGQHVYSGGNMREHSGSFGFSSLGPHDSMAGGMVGGSVVGGGGGGGGVHSYGVPGHGLGQQHMAPHPGAHHSMGMVPAPTPPAPSSGMVPIPGGMGHAGGGVGAVAGAAGDGSEVHRRFIGAYSPDARRRRIERCVESTARDAPPQRHCLRAPLIVRPCPLRRSPPYNAHPLRSTMPRATTMSQIFGEAEQTCVDQEGEVRCAQKLCGLAAAREGALCQKGGRRIAA
jgi:hypothetical protein